MHGGDEAAVVGGMPVAGRHDRFEAGRQGVGHRYRRVAVGDGQRAAGHEVVLQINDDQRIHRLLRGHWGIRRPRVPPWRHDFLEELTGWTWTVKGLETDAPGWSFERPMRMC